MKNLFEQLMNRKGTRFKKIFSLLVLVDIFVTNLFVTVILALMLIYEGLTLLSVKSSRELFLSSEAHTSSASKGDTVGVRIRMEGETFPILLASGSCDVHLENILTGENSVIPSRFLMNRTGGIISRLRLTETRCGTVRVQIHNGKIQDAFGRRTQPIPAGEIAEVTFNPSVTTVDLPQLLYNSGQPDLPLRAEDIGILFMNYSEGESALTPMKKSESTEFLLSLSKTLIDAKLPHEVIWLTNSPEAPVTRSRLLKADADWKEAAEEMLRCGFVEDGRARQILQAAAAERGYSAWLVVSAGEDSGPLIFDEKCEVRVFKA